MSQKRLDRDRVFDFYLLEDRILLSGEGADGADASGQIDAELSAALMAEVDGQGPLGEAAVNEAVAVNASLETPTDELADTESSDPLQPLEVVFVDEGVEDAQTLLDGLQQDGERQWLVIYLSSQENGIDQISDTLAELSQVDAIHLVSHGDGGGIQLGNTRLDLASAPGYAGQIASWADALDADADILIYGCDLASTSAGRELIDSVATLTGADVAASEDTTGHQLLEGDWELEYTVGLIETEVAFSLEAQQAWTDSLDVTEDDLSTGLIANGSSSTSISHTASGSNRLLLVGVSFGEDNGNSVSSITFNGQALTLIGAQENADTSASRVEIWGLVAPSVGTSNVVVNLTGTNHEGASIGVMSFNEVDQTTPWENFNSAEGDSPNPLVNVASGANDLVFGVVGFTDSNNWDISPGNGQTEKWDLFSGKTNGSGTVEAGSANVTTSWNVGTSGKWAAAGVSINSLPIVSTGVTFWTSTTDNVTGSSAPGLSNWTDSEVLEFGDPNLSLDPGTTNGTFSSQFDLSNFTTNTDVDAIHYVNADITVGTNNFDLYAGDVILSLDDNQTLTSTNSLTVDDNDAFVFRPDTAGDYSSGTFLMLIDESDVGAVKAIESITLVENTTTVGGVVLNAGTFLFTKWVNEDGDNADVFHFTPGTLGDTTSGTSTTLVNGSQININVNSENANEFIDGLDLIEYETTVGGETLTVGQLLLSLHHDDGSVGDNNISTSREDIFILDVTTGGATTVANATLLLDGSDVTLTSSAENIDAFSLNTPAPTITEIETVDADGDGQIDQIRITTDQNLDDDFSGLTVDVAGYVETGFSTGSANDNVFYVDLLERGSSDTDATPNVTVSANTTLSGIWGGNLAVTSAVSATDAAAPVLLSAMAASGSTSLELTFSEAVYTTTGGSGAIQSGDVVYGNNQAGGATSVVGVTESNGGDGVITVSTDVAFAVSDFGVDTIRAASLGIFDAADVEASTAPVAIQSTTPTAVNDSYSVDEDGVLVVGPTTAGLQDHWTFDEGTGQTVADSVSPANDGTLGADTGVATDDPTWTTGPWGTSALSFDGNDYVATTSTTAKTAAEFTLSAFFQANTTSGQQHLLWQGYTGGNGYGSAPGTTAESEMGITIGNYNQANKIVFFMGYDVPVNGADAIHIISSSDFTDTSEWHHVAVTVTDLGGGTLSASLYVDGVLEGTDTGTQNDRSAWGNLQIGKPGANTRYFNGSIDDVRVYDNDLTATEVLELAKPGVLVNDSDADTPVLDAILVSGPTDGILTFNVDGTFTYTPDDDFFGTDSFTYKANDGTTDSPTATVDITVNAINDDPVFTSANAVSINENVTSVMTVTATDVEGPSPTFSLTGGADQALFTIDTNSGALSFLSAPDYESPLDFDASNDYEVEVTASDGTTGTAVQTITVTVLNVADTSFDSASTAIWTDKNNAIPLSADFNGIEFSSASNTDNIGGPWRNIAGAESPDRDEKIVVGVDALGNLSGQMWDGSSWNAFTFNDFATVTDSTKMGFAIEYESVSGDAVLVWNNGTTGTSSLSYRVWDGTAWSATNTITTPLAGEAEQMRVCHDHFSDEIVLVVSNANHEDYALVWDGDNWGNAQVLTTNAGINNMEVVIQHESLSGDAMVVYGDNSSNAYYRIWNGTTWSAQQTITPPAGVTGELDWASLESDPNSDRLGFAAHTSDDDTWLAVWDGSSWGDQLLASTSEKGNDFQSVAVAFESVTGDLLAVYSEDNNRISYRTWDDTSGWSGESQGPDFGNKVRTLTLESRQVTNQIMLTALDDGKDIVSVHWDGQTWGELIELENDSDETANKPFIFLWDSNPPELVAAQNDTAFWFTTKDDITSSGMAGLNSWTGGEVLAIGDPDLKLEPVNGTTSGTAISVFNLDDFAGDARVDALHYVGSDIQVGSSNFDLFEGDVLFSTKDDETLVSTNTLSIFRNDVVVFRADTVGDYSSGTFYILLDDPIANDVRGVSLVEQNTTVGDTTLQAGDFLILSGGGAANDKKIFVFETTDVGVGTTSGTTQVLLDGSDSNFDVTEKLSGIELYETDTTIGGHTILAGTIAVSVERASDIGSNNLSVTAHDIVGLTVTQTTLVAGAGNGAATATMLMDGSDLGLVVDREGIRSIAAIPNNQAPTDISPDSAAVNEHVDTSGGLSVATLTTTDPDAGDTFTYSIVGGTDAASFFIGGASSDELMLNDGVLDFENQSSYSVTVRTTDSALNYYDETLTINVNDLNDAPTLDNTGSMTLTTITEDQTANSGDSVADIILTAGGNPIDDQDTGAQEGIAVTGLTSGNGTWQYTLDGSTWIDVGAVSGTNALLLESDDRLRFVPDTIDADSASVTFRAWDRTTGAAGAKVNATVTGGATAFSVDSETANLTVTAVNDAPTVLTNTGTTVLEGSTGTTITTAMLNEGDVDDAGAGLTYTVTNVTDNGTLFLAGFGALGLNDTFTQADIDAGDVTYDHDDSETTSDAFSFSLADGGEDGATPATGTFNITVTPVNENPTDISPNSFGVNELTDTSGGLSVGTLVTTDPDVSESFSYTIVGGADQPGSASEVAEVMN